jgi:hypothetical protein
VQVAFHLTISRRLKQDKYDRHENNTYKDIGSISEKKHLFQRMLFPYKKPSDETTGDAEQYIYDQINYEFHEFIWVVAISKVYSF